MILVLALFIAANTDGSSANIIGGISVLAMILAIATCVAGVHMARNDNFEKYPVSLAWSFRRSRRHAGAIFILYRYSDWIKDRWVEK